MKNIQLIFVCALLALSSCSLRELMPAPSPATVSVGITLSGMPAATKALTDLSPVRVLVFDELGYLVEQAEGYGFSYGAGADGRETRFSVDLTATSEYRRLHIVAGVATPAAAFGSESQVFAALYTTGGETAWWQCVELPGGIADDMDPAPLRRVVMVRNTATVSVVNDDPGFTMYGFKVVNIPSHGSVAPWVAGSGPFMGYAADAAPVYADLHEAGYSGWTPQGVGELTSTGWETTPVTVYEHPYTANPSTYTCILIWGRLPGVERDSYYKFDLVRTLADNSNEYLDVLRNISYVFTITSMGSTGYATEAEAFAKPAGNNISGSINTGDLDNISDGRGQLFLSSTDIIIVDSEPVTFSYKFIPDIITAPNTVDNGSVTLSAPAGEVLSQPAAVASYDASGGWRKVTLYPNADDGMVHSQTIRLATSSGLTKNVRLRRRSRYELSATVAPSSVDQVIGSSVSLSFTLPEGLPESIFPLEMVVSSAGGTVYPDPSGTAMPVTVQDGSYGYSFEISRAQYEASRTFTCPLLTNKVRSATTVTVSNRYFTTVGAAFANNPRYVTSFTIPAKSLHVTNLSSSYNSFYLYYDEDRRSRVNNTTYRFYAYGPTDNTTVTVGSMLSTDMIYFYNTSRRTVVGMSIEDLEEGGHTL